MFMNSEHIQESTAIRRFLEFLKSNGSGASENSHAFSRQYVKTFRLGKSSGKGRFSASVLTAIICHKRKPLRNRCVIPDTSELPLNSAAAVQRRNPKRLIPGNTVVDTGAFSEVRMTVMVRLISLCVYVVAILTVHAATMAQDTGLPPVSGSPTSQHPVATNSLAKYAAVRTGNATLPNGAFNGFRQIRVTPDLGAPGSAGNGFNHFPLPLDKYTNWYRPRAASLTQYQRCAPDDFRPRGFGHLFARPCDGFRMEYEPYAISDGMSNYGPAYFSRLPNPQCDSCDHCDDDCEDCKK
jgi:hypothetical protein